MAALDRQIRTSNKEPEWSSLCNNVFEQYLDPDDVFGFEKEPCQRSSSNDSINIFDSSAGSEQSNQTSGTSPIPAWLHEDKLRTPRNVDTQPRAQAAPDFWTKTLRALEKNAADSESKPQRLRSTKSHPDFLSLGGFPSPPAIPGSPTGQSLSIRRQRSRVFGDAANGRKQNQARSVSRGRPSGVVKSAPIPPNPYATVRKTSVSPRKMMSPSRYRSGFKDIWADRIATSPDKKWDISIPSNDMGMDSTPSSARFPESGDLTNVFGSPTAKCTSALMYDEALSPLTTTFQQAHIHTPDTSPAIRRNAAAHAANAAYFGDIPPVPPITYTRTGPLNDTAPLFPERISPLAPNGLEQFDFGFSDPDDHLPLPTKNPWNISSSYTTNQPSANNDDPFASLNSPIFPSIETDNALDMTSGLGISYEPMTLPTTPLYTPAYPFHHGLPLTPHRTRPHPSTVGPFSPSPTPTPKTERRPTRRSTSISRTRHHRRTKSAGPPSTSISTKTSSSSTSSTTKAGGGGGGGGAAGIGGAGFVNYTPQDSSKILNGVAPSGSSKTKARREKEAADKRRKLSQAALKAVVEAGGSVEGIEGLIDDSFF